MKKEMKIFIVFALLLVSATVVGSGVPAQAKGIHSKSAAKKAALKKVPSATVKEIELEDDGTNYDVELYKGDKEYSLLYRTSDGKLLKYSWDIMNPSVTKQSKKTISKKEIKKKAKKKVKNATVDSVRLDYDDGIQCYEIKMSKGLKKYELIYDSKSGKLLEYKWIRLIKKEVDD